MDKQVVLAKRPDLVLKLEKYGLLPPCKPGGKYNGCAKKWAKESTPPYDTPEAQALAERLPTGWEELPTKEFDQLLNALQAAIEEKRKERLDTPNRGAERMLRNMAKIAFIGITAAASLIEVSGLGILPDEDENDKKQAAKLSFELVLHLICGTNVLKQIFMEIARTTNTTNENQEMIAEILKLMAVLLAILAASQGKQGRLKELMSSFKGEISKGIKKTERFVSEGLLNETLSGEKAEETSLLLQQAKIALEKEDFEGFYETYKEALGLLNVTTEMMIGDLGEVQVFARKLQTALTSGVADETATIATVSQAM
jgi:hypothetical protein